MELGGWIDACADESVPVTCTECWKRPRAVPIEPQWRTGIRADGEPVLVNMKRIEDHDRGSKLGVVWRRDGHVWMFWFAIVWTVNAVTWWILR